jgi:hypothetical protein
MFLSAMDGYPSSGEATHRHMAYAVFAPVLRRCAFRAAAGNAAAAPADGGSGRSLVAAAAACRGQSLVLGLVVLPDEPTICAIVVSAPTLKVLPVTVQPVAL